MKLGRWDWGVRRAMRGRERFKVHFSISQTAASLWDYGEDALAERALKMSEKDLGAIQRIAAVYEDPNYPLPIDGQRITHNHVNAISAVAYLEGHLRPLTRTRRRAEKTRPERFAPRSPEAGPQAEQDW